jgi:hypothetical protein
MIVAKDGKQVKPIVFAAGGFLGVRAVTVVTVVPFPAGKKEKEEKD